MKKIFVKQGDRVELYNEKEVIVIGYDGHGRAFGDDVKDGTNIIAFEESDIKALNGCISNYNLYIIPTSETKTKMVTVNNCQFYIKNSEEIDACTSINEIVEGLYDEINSKNDVNKKYHYRVTIKIEKQEYCIEDI